MIENETVLYSFYMFILLAILIISSFERLESIYIKCVCASLLHTSEEYPSFHYIQRQHHLYLYIPMH